MELPQKQLTITPTDSEDILMEAVLNAGECDRTRNLVSHLLKGLKHDDIEVTCKMIALNQKDTVVTPEQSQDIW